MTRNDTSRRQQLVARLKSAIATAAIVGTIGGWMAFGAQQMFATTSATTPAVAQVAESSSTTATTSTTAAATAQAAGSSSSAASAPTATWRGSTPLMDNQSWYPRGCGR
jgi:hypothetical protein